MPRQIEQFIRKMCEYAKVKLSVAFALFYFDQNASLFIIQFFEEDIFPRQANLFFSRKSHELHNL